MGIDGLDAGYRMQDTGYRMLDAGYWMLDARFRIPENGGGSR